MKSKRKQLTRLEDKILEKQIRDKYINNRDVPLYIINKKEWIHSKIQAIKQDMKNHEYVQFIKETNKKRIDDPLYGLDIISDSEDEY